MTKKISHIRLLVPVFLALVVSGCTKYVDFFPHHLLTITNQSDKSVTWIVPERELDRTGFCSEDLPQTLTAAIEEQIRDNVIAARSSSRLKVNDGRSNTVLDEYFAGDVVCFYFFDTATLSNNSWETIVADKMWLKKMPLSASDVIGMDKEIVFTK